MRDYKHFDEYLNDLGGDIYSQPPDPGHTAWAKAAIDWWEPSGKVLDVGCGSGFCYDLLKEYGVVYTGVTANANDVRIAQEHGLEISIEDMTFLPYEDNTFDAVFSRHVLEHSPFPILSLMEWRRVAEELMLIVPAPDYWGWEGKNHYSVAEYAQLWWWLRRSGWKITKESVFRTDNETFVEYYAGNQKRVRDGKSIVQFPGSPKIVEYWILCKRGEFIKE